MEYSQNVFTFRKCKGKMIIPCFLFWQILDEHLDTMFLVLETTNMQTTKNVFLLLFAYHRRWSYCNCFIKVSYHFFSRGIAHFSKVLCDCFILYLLGQLEYPKFKQSGQSLIIGSIVEAANFEFHNTEYKPGRNNGNLSREIMQQLDTGDSNVKDYKNFLSNFIYCIISFSGF